MERKFELSLEFCMFNQVCVIESKENYILFGILDEENYELQEKLYRSAKLFFDAGNVIVEFKKILKEELEKYVAMGLSQEEKAWEEIREESDTVHNAVVLLLDSILREGKRQQATDIHIEENCVRFRVRGLLKTEFHLSRQKTEELVRRIKVQAKMNLLEKRRPQDGQFVHRIENSPLYVRCSLIPVIKKDFSEDFEAMVLRLLDPERIPLQLEKLGFSEKQLDEFGSIARQKNGLFLITGPTGSGKSTTAASFLMRLKELHSGKRKIVSIEDPVEYFLDGVTQINSGKNSAFGFEDILPAVFRHDPDIIFLGEIRDCKTAEVALQASLTGHFVIATLHTDSFVSAFLRLKSLGIEEKLLCQAIRGIVVQELVNSGETVFLKAKVFNAGNKGFDRLESRLKEENSAEYFEELGI